MLAEECPSTKGQCGRFSLANNRTRGVVSRDALTSALSGSTPNLVSASSYVYSLGGTTVEA